MPIPEGWLINSDTLYSTYSLEQGAANFFYKGPHMSILGLAGHIQSPCIFFFGVLCCFTIL